MMQHAVIIAMNACFRTELLQKIQCHVQIVRYGLKELDWLCSFTFQYFRRTSSQLIPILTVTRSTTTFGNCKSLDVTMSTIKFLLSDLFYYL